MALCNSVHLELITIDKRVRILEDIVKNVTEVSQPVEHIAKLVQGLASLMQAVSGKKDEVGSGASHGIQNNELIEIVSAAQLDAIRAQDVQAKLSMRVRELEDELRKKDNWDQERARYYLKEVGQAAFAYCLRDEYVSDDEPRHLICPTCAAEARKTLVHQEAINRFQTILRCFRCSTRIRCRSNPLDSST